MLERSSLVIFTICSFLHNCEKLKTLLKQGDYLRHYPQHSCPTPPPFLSTQLSSTPLPNALLTFAAPHPCPRGTAYVLACLSVVAAVRRIASLVVLARVTVLAMSSTRHPRHPLRATSRPPSLYLAIAPVFHPIPSCIAARLIIYHPSHHSHLRCKVDTALLPPLSTPNDPPIAPPPPHLAPTHLPPPLPPDTSPLPSPSPPQLVQTAPTPPSFLLMPPRPLNTMQPSCPRPSTLTASAAT